MRSLIVFFLSGFLLSAQAATDRPVIESIIGGKTVTVTSAKKKQRQAAEGDALANGDRLRTTAKTAVRVLYPDNTQLLLGQSSEIEILPKQKEAERAHLNVGLLRSKVIPSPSTGAKKVRFIVRTKTATMGVRGTEFVTETDAKGQNTELHTLDGSVDMAKSETELLAGKGMAVLKDQFAKADLRKIFPAQKFDPNQYKTLLLQRQPEVSSLIEKAPKPREELEKLRGQVTSQVPAQGQIPSQVPSLPAVPKPALPANPFGH